MSLSLPQPDAHVDWRTWANAVMIELQAWAQTIQPTDFAALPTYADDAAAASGGLKVGGLYKTGSAVKVRVA